MGPGLLHRELMVAEQARRLEPAPREVRARALARLTAWLFQRA